MLTTLADTLRVLSMCYSTAIGIDSLYQVQGRIVEQPETSAIAWTQFTPGDSMIHAWVTFNRPRLAGKSEDFIRHIVVHELLHIYWYPAQNAFWLQYGKEKFNLMELLTERQSLRPMWLKMCPIPSGRPPDG